MVRRFRAVGVFILNFVLASITTAVLVAPFERRHSSSANEGIFKDFMLSASDAFVLGYLVRNLWPRIASRWIWIAGLLLFGQQAVRIWFEQRYFSVYFRGEVRYTNMIGIDCYPEGCRDAFLCTLIFLRTLFYSAGNVCCSFMVRHGLSLGDVVRKMRR